MSGVSDDVLRQLADYGALSSQIVDLAGEEGPRTLRYVDLVRAPAAGRPPVVIESHGQPRAYVFVARGIDANPSVAQWIRRVAFRGDADWVGILRPGRLEIFRAVLDGSDTPQPVQGLPAGPLLFPALVHAPPVGIAMSMRSRLLELLRRSISQAKGFNLAAPDALSLVGRALFWRFLIDRGLLEGLDRDEVCPHASDWPACLSTKANALKTFAWLDDTFNGGLLPFTSPPRGFPADVFQRVVGNIAHLATPEGQLPLQLPNDWSEVNFAHVPVGLLSEVYEAYAHGEDIERAKAESIFYTPRHIAELLVDEALDAAADVPLPRVLDPAAGAGVFLVAMFRALVAREWKRAGKKPSRKLVRRILNDQLTGFDINDSALRLAELALYLTAIELDPEAKPRPLKLLKFDEPRGRVLLRKTGGVAEGSLAPVEERFRGAFDIVVGNPPWTAHGSLEAKKRWVDTTRGLIRMRLGDARAATFDFPDTNPDLPFVYRAMEWAKPGGAIALVTHARWLFGQSKRAVRARNDLLESVHVTGVLNGTALRETNVWPNVRHPFCLLFAANELPPARAAFLFVSPDLDRMPDAEQAHLRIDWQDAREVEIRELAERPWILKVRFRGTPFDESVLEDLMRRGVPLGRYLGVLGTKLENGYQVGRAGEKQPARHMHHLPDLKGASLGFVIDTRQLPRFSHATLWRPRKPAIYRGPLLLVHESMRVGEQSPRAALSFEDVAFDERFDGVSFADVQHGASIARYLQLVIQSALFQHALLMLDGQFGIEREVVHKATIESVPVVPWDLLTKSQRSQSLGLSQRLHHGMTEELLAEIDRFVADVFELSNVQRTTIADTLRTALPTAGAKKAAVQRTTPAEREQFVAVCQDELRNVLRASRKDAFVWLRDDLELVGAWRVVQIDRVEQGSGRPAAIRLDTRRFVEAADEAAASLVTVQVNERTALVGLLDRYRYWTQTRARMLAASLLSESGTHA